MWKVMSWFQTSEEAQGLAEYGLILALIAVASVAALTTLGGDISDLLESLAGSISGG